MSSIIYDNLSQAYWQLGAYEAGLDEARAAIDEARRAQPELSLKMVQDMYGVARPEIDARRNAVLRQAGLE
jgi:hypothetical protein